MIDHPVTGSTVGVRMACAPSGTLPQSKTETYAQRRGTWCHLYLEVCAEKSPEAAIAAIEAAGADDDVIEYCRGLDLARALPNGASRGTTEITFAFRVTDRTARVVGRRLSRDYRGVSDVEIPGTADVVLGLDGEWAIDDYKFTEFDLYAPEPKRSGQLKFLGMCLMLEKGLDHVLLRSRRIDSSGNVFVDAWTMDHFAMADFMEAFMAALATPEQGVLPVFSEGLHCHSCKSFKFCPAKHHLMQTALAESKIAEFSIHIDENTAPGLVQKVRDLEDLHIFLKKQLDEYALHNPIPLPGGHVYRQTTKTVRSMPDVDAVQKALVEIHGEKAMALINIKRSYTITGFTEKLGKAESDKTMKELEKRGLVAKKDIHSIGVVTEKKALKASKN